MQKNYTPLQIAFFCSCIVTGALLGIFLIAEVFAKELYNPRFILSTVVLVFILSLTVFYFFIDYFIYRKIKIIYKTINESKSNKKSKNLLKQNIRSQKNPIEEAEIEVFEWAENKESEIAQLKAMEAFRKDYLGNVSHELRTPVFNIQGYLETLLDGGLTDSNINYKYLNKAAKNTERLIALIDDLQTINKLENNIVELQFENFDILQLAKEVFETLELSSKSKNIELGIKEGCETNFIVNADREKIRHVLENLVGNSIKYGKQNGNTKIGFYDMDERVLIEVSDNGVGIAQKHLPRLFERFYRIDKSRSRNEGGTGLGLAIVKHIIEAHKQRINVRSTLSLGSTFGFTLEKV